MKKSYLIWIAAIVIIVLGIWGASKLAAPTEGTLAGEITAADQVKGNRNASIVLVEYSDFQCPACKTYYPFVKQLAQDYSNDVAIVYRHFPLRQIHPFAELAAVVSEAAGRQGKFWEMHDLLFDNQEQWSKSANPQAAMLGYVRELGLDLDKFEADINDKALVDKVREDYRTGDRSKVGGTPTFFLNGEMISTPRSYDEFKQLIDNAKRTATTSTSEPAQATGTQATSSTGR